jgi:ABC-type multidrug transport system fused ATPase/permease subunit
MSQIKPESDEAMPQDTESARGKPGRKKGSRGQFWRAFRFLWPYRRKVLLAVLCAMLTGAFTAGGLMSLVPLMSVLIRGQTVSGYVAERIAARGFEGALPLEWRIAEWAAGLVPENPVYAIATIFGGIFLLGLCGSATRFFQEFLSDTCAIGAVNDIRRKLYDRVLHLPLGYFTRHGTGDLTARLLTDAQGLQDGFKTFLGPAIQEPIKALVALGVAMWLDWRLTIFIILFTPVMVAVIRKLGTKVRRAMRASLEKSSAMLGQIDATLSGIRVVKSATAEPFERRRYRAVIQKLKVEQVRMARYEAWSTPTLEMLGLLAVGCVLIFASYLVFEHKSFDPPQLIVLMLCLVAIAEPMRRISKLNNVLQRSNAASGRIFEILDAAHTETEIASARGTDRAETTGSSASDASSAGMASTKTGRARVAVPESFEREITFEDVTFAYPGAEQPALRGISLRVRRGESVAVVGRNGSGKTTLLTLLPRYFDPSAGRVAIDGVDVRDWPLRRLRRMIGVVTQEAVVFPGTIAENIAYARPTASIERIIEAARRAYAHEFIEQKPQGYNTPLDGLGGQLSGGQRQRLNIARAILRDSPILILDEATSQVDAESEHLIQQAITDLMKDRTTFVIAHRFSTILSCDRIVVLEAGNIVGEGTHDSLLSTCVTYQQLYERQLLG